MLRGDRCDRKPSAVLPTHGRGLLPSLLHPRPLHANAPTALTLHRAQHALLRVQITRAHMCAPPHAYTRFNHAGGMCAALRYDIGYGMCGACSHACMLACVLDGPLSARPSTHPSRDHVLQVCSQGVKAPAASLRFIKSVAITVALSTDAAPPAEPLSDALIQVQGGSVMCLPRATKTSSRHHEIGYGELAQVDECCSATDVSCQIPRCAAPSELCLGGILALNGTLCLPSACRITDLAECQFRGGGERACCTDVVRREAVPCCYPTDSSCVLDPVALAQIVRLAERRHQASSLHLAIACCVPSMHFPELSPVAFLSLHALAPFIPLSSHHALHLHTLPCDWAHLTACMTLPGPQGGSAQRTEAQGSATAGPGAAGTPPVRSAPPRRQGTTSAPRGPARVPVVGPAAV